MTRRQMAAECERVKTASAGTSDRTTALLYALAAVVAALVAEETAT